MAFFFFFFFKQNCSIFEQAAVKRFVLPSQRVLGFFFQIFFFFLKTVLLSNVFLTVRGFKHCVNAGGMKYVCCDLQKPLFLLFFVCFFPTFPPWYFNDDSFDFNFFFFSWTFPPSVLFDSGLDWRAFSLIEGRFLESDVSAVISSTVVVSESITVPRSASSSSAPSVS